MRFSQKPQITKDFLADIYIFVFMEKTKNGSFGLPIRERMREGDEQIKKLSASAKKYLISGILLLIIATILLIVKLVLSASSIEFLLVAIKMVIGLWLISKGFKKLAKGKLLRKKKSELKLDGSENRLLSIDLFKAISSYKQKTDKMKLHDLMERHINASNFKKIDRDYEVEYFESFIDALLNISINYNEIRDVFEPLIKIGVVEERYPHSLRKAE